MSLRRQTFSGVRWTTTSSAGRILLQLLQVSVLARLVLPADFGLVAVVLAVLAVLQIFADAGVSNAILHYRDVAASEAASLYWLNVAFAGALALGLAGASPLVSAWYHAPALQPLLATAAASLFVGALGQQLRVMAQKQLRFGDLALVEFGGALVGCVVAIGLAVAGAGAYALVVGGLATAGATTALAWWRLADGWRPRLGIRKHEVGRFVSFGAYIVGGNLANTLNSQLDVLLGAQILGAPAMGLYSVPKDLSLRLAGVINPIVTEVSSPVMSSVQADEGRVRQMYLQMMRMIASVTFPAYVALAVFAPEVVHLALGRNWEHAVPLLRVLAVWAMLRSTGNPVGTLVLAKGRPDLGLAWNLALLAVIPPSVWVGSRYGLGGMTVAMAIVALLLVLPNWYFLVRRLCGARLGEYLEQLAVPLGLAVLAGVGGLVAARPFRGDLLRVLAGGAGGAVVYVALSWFLNPSWTLAVFELVGASRWLSPQALAGSQRAVSDGVPRRPAVPGRP